MIQPPVSETTRRRLMATLFSAQSVFNAAQNVSFSLLPLAAVYLTGTEATAGLPTTIVLAGRALIAYPIGWLMDRLGRRRGIALGLLLSVIGAGLCAAAIAWQSFALFCLGGLLNGMGRGAGEQSRYAAADVELPARAARAIGTIVFAGTIGAVVGPLLIAPSERWATTQGIAELTGPYALTSVLSFVAFLVIYAFLRPDPLEISRRLAHNSVSTVDGNIPARGQRTIFSDPNVQLAVFTLGASQLVMTLIMVITPLHMSHSHHSTQSITWVVMAHTLGMFGLSSVTGWLVNRYGKPLMILLAGLILAASAVMAPMATTVPMLAAALFLLGLGWNFGFVAGSALLSSALSASERGKTQGVSETLVAVAAAAGSISTGVAFHWGGLLAVCMIGLALSLALIVALGWLRRGGQPADVNIDTSRAHTR